MFNVVRKAGRPTPNTVSQIAIAEFVIRDTAIETAKRVSKVYAGGRRRTEILREVGPIFGAPFGVNEVFRVDQRTIVRPAPESNGLHHG